MPSVDLAVQANGTLTGWSAIVGGTFGYDAIDDSDAVSNDGDTSYLILPRQIGPTAGIMSFRFFLGAEGMTPTSIAIRTETKVNSGGPEIMVGFYRGGVTVFSGTTIFPGAGSYTSDVTTFTTSPFNGQPWTAADLTGLEVCLQMAPVIGTALVTLISVSLDYSTSIYSREAQAAEDYGVLVA